MLMLCGGGACGVCASQVLILPNFHDFPSDAITVEFWMNSIDTCRPGVPFSYAHGEYEKQDNSFLIFNYNAFGVSRDSRGRDSRRGNGHKACSCVYGRAPSCFPVFPFILRIQ